MVESDSDSSSDSNGDLEKFADAIYPGFNILPARKIGLESNGEVSQSKSQNAKPNTTSKRIGKSEEWECGHFVHRLKLTSSTQEFVSKQLSQSLDRQIKDKKSSKLNVVTNTEDDQGIFLFQSSTRRLRGKDLRRYEKRFQKKARKKVHTKSDSDSEDDGKLESVAVNADWVLNPRTV
ncbi:unnamed protein product [Allacma fusca]|uniref:Uncharacterized protein n=1 Tax=Allacma fusca TaxID=39272 RepID=A0A8J2KKW1_9HEXA|nr:unnamed protein product [Allacma fusca]